MARTVIPPLATFSIVAGLAIEVTEGNPKPDHWCSLFFFSSLSERRRALWDKKKIHVAPPPSTTILDMKPIKIEQRADPNNNTATHFFRTSVVGGGLELLGERET
ncbi:hypothetical protein U1Q18_007795 [Sarracenia purpurea var. burkii]